MRTVDLTKEKHSLKELLTLAKSETLLIRSPSGEDFLLEQADEFDREVAALGSSGNLWHSWTLDRLVVPDFPHRVVQRGGA
jgi:hypothetical protein